MVLARDSLWEDARGVTPVGRWINPPQTFTVVPGEIVLQTQLLAADFLRLSQ